MVRVDIAPATGDDPLERCSFFLAALKPEHRLVSNAFCTTNCLAPMAKVLDDNFGIERGMITTVHAYTNDQRLAEATLSKEVGVEDVNAAMKEAAESSMRGIVEYSTGALVSIDIVGNPHSCIFDAPLTQTLSGSRTVKCLAWYDNEWGYANRVVDLARKMAG